jgi:glycine/D-amino acid oxidase-like deaminating enzyme
LQKLGHSVLVLEQSITPANATRYSYGGIAYWSGTTDLTRQLCQEGLDLHRQLPTELDSPTYFQEIDLLLAVEPDRDPTQIASNYKQFAVPPVILDAATACELEPLLNRSAIAGALHFPHALVSPEATVAAYNQAFLRLGGAIQITPVIDWKRQARRFEGVITPEGTYSAANLAICTGATTRALLRSIGLPIRLYFTQAELIETVPTEIKLRTLLMPAELKRFAMEAEAAAIADTIWDQPGQEVTPAILDAGVVQLWDGRLRMGQVSRTLTDLTGQGDAARSEAAIREAIGKLLPALGQIPGQWHCCQVSFSGDRLPVVGAIPNTMGLHVFSGFSSPFAILPPLARRFAQATTGAADPILVQLDPGRFASSARIE